MPTEFIPDISNRFSEPHLRALLTEFWHNNPEHRAGFIIVDGEPLKMTGDCLYAFHVWLAAVGVITFEEALAGNLAMAKLAREIP